MNDQYSQGRRDDRAQLAPQRATSDNDLARPLPAAGWGYEETDNKGFDAQQLAGIIKRRRRLILGTFALITALGVLATVFSKPIYESKARVLIDTSKATPSSGDFSALDAMAGMSSARNLAKQVEIFQSPSVIDAARKEISPGARKILSEYLSLNVQQVGQTDIMEVTVQTRNPNASSAYCNALVRAYMAEDENTQHSGMRRASSFVRDKVIEKKKQRDAVARQLRDYKLKNQTMDVGAETAAQISTLGGAVSDREKAQAERRAASAELAEVQRQASRLPSTIVTGKSIGQTANAVAKKAELTALESKLQELKQEYTDSAPDVVATRARIAQLKGDLARANQTEVTGSQLAPNPALDAARAKIAELRGVIGAADARIAAFQKTESQLRASANSLPKREYDVGLLQSELLRLNETYQALNQKYEQLRINENATSASTRILSTASASRTPISPRIGRNILTTLIAALVLAIALAALVDRMDDHIHSEEDAESAARLPIIAHVPFVTGGDSASLLNGGGIKGSSALLESYRMLRTNIAFASIDEPIRSLVVTSSTPNEGKSTAALDLAIVMALDGKAVILLDADLRRPSQNGLLQLGNAIGFSSVVTGNNSVAEALQDTSVKNLRVMTSGPVPPNPPELLNSRTGRQVIEELAGMADFLIIDTPPALTMSDAQIAASIADATVLVVSAQDASKKDVARTSDLMAQTGTKMLGVVLNKITREWGNAYSYYGTENVYYGTNTAAETLATNERPTSAPQLPEDAKK